MRHTITTLLVVTICLLGAGMSQAATYGWSGGGGNNLWSNANNWTNVVGGAPGVPVAGDTAQFWEFEDDVVAVQNNVTVTSLKLGIGGMSITGAYTITVTAANGFGTVASTATGSASLGCHLSLSSGNHLLVNWNQTLTFNGNVTVLTSTADQTFEIKGPNASVVFNGQLTHPNANFSLFAQDDGQFVINGVQQNHTRRLQLKKGFLVVKANVGGPADDTNHTLGFQGDWGATPKSIVFDAGTTPQMITNRLFLHRGGVGNYQEVRFKTKVTTLTSQPRLISTANHWYFWEVEPGSYVKVPGFTASGALTMCFGGGGTTDVTAAQAEVTPFTVIISNGVLLVNNTSGFALYGPIVVHSGGVFGGAGFVRSVVTNTSGGRISPGNSIGTLTVSNAVLRAGSIVDWEVSGSTADRLAVLNNLNISEGAVTVRVINAGSISLGVTNEVFSYASLVGNMATDIHVDKSGVPTYEAEVVATATGIGLVLTPEPGVAVALVAGLAVLGRKRR